MSRVWNLESSLDSAGALSPVVPGSQVTAEFRDGQLNGNAGCNNYFASYQTTDNAIQISGAGSTEMFCTAPEGVMDQEAAYLKTLSLAATYDITGGQLKIADASGKPILVYRAASPAVLTGVTWQMTMVNNGQDAVVSALAGSEVTALFGEDGSLTGSAGCNRYTASYQLDGDSLTVGPAASTMMMCPDPEGVMDQEAAYLKALETVASFELSGDRLTLRTASGAIAVEYSLAESIGISDTIWNMSLFYIGGDAVTNPLAGTSITALFAEDGKLSGSTGCNQYFSTYKLDGDQLTIGPLGSTKMACPEPPGVMEQEVAILALLENTSAYYINADTLFLLDANGSLLAEFTASPLIGVVWKWQQFQSNDDTLQAPSDPGQYTLEFMKDGTVAIQADCNRAAGTYTLNGNQMTIEIGPVTLALCPEGSLSEEYLRLLGDVVIYLFEGQDLYLDIMFDSGTMKFSQ
jgi:heat shock protein HslJ